MVKLSRVMFLLLCHVTSLAKQFVFLTDADRIESMVAGLDGTTPLPNTNFNAMVVVAVSELPQLYSIVVENCKVLKKKDIHYWSV